MSNPAEKLHAMDDYIRLLNRRSGHKLAGEIKGRDPQSRFQPSQRAASSR
jgi:hypothetical protein